MIHSDVFVHASHIDNSPNSLCEAMLLGMPVIATFAGGIPSILKDKHEGLLVQDGDPYAMAGAMLELFEDAEYAKTLGLNARQTAMLRHNPDTITKNMVQIYSSVIEKQSSGN
jgi:glycosyltransferase involved in cell wall biosynthesis